MFGTRRSVLRVGGKHWVLSIGHQALGIERCVPSVQNIEELSGRSVRENLHFTVSVPVLGKLGRWKIRSLYTLDEIVGTCKNSGKKARFAL